MRTATREQGTGPQAPPLSEQLGRALAAQADEVFRQGQVEVHLRLDPAELGTIRVHLSAVDNTLVARVLVAQVGTQHLLEGQAAQLRQALADSGLVLGHFDVRHEAGSGGSGRQAQQEQTGEPLPPVTPPPLRAARKAATSAPTASPDAVNLLA